MSEHRCNQSNCGALPVVRFTWPGRDEAFACTVHARQLERLADALGFHLQIIPLSEEPPCNGRGGEQE